MTLLSDRLGEIKPSPTLSIKAKATELKASGVNIVDFAAGEPDYPTPKHICEAAKQAIDKGKHKYTAVGGIPELKKAIINKFRRDNSLEFNPNQVIVTPGGKMAIYSAFMATINPGDEVIIPAPFWVSYPDMALLAGGIPVILECPESQDFKVTPDQIEESISESARWFILNSPSNPTGALYTKEELEAIGDVLRKHPKILILSDDIYEHLVYDESKFHTIAEVCPDLQDRILTINGASKTYSMTGWRMGYAAGPADLIKGMTTIQSQSTSNVCSITQYAALAALDGDQSFLNDWRAEYSHRRDILVGKLNAIDGLSCATPHGAFYAYVNCEGLIGKQQPDGKVIETDLDLAEYLMTECHVAVVPGTAFGLSPYFRATYSTSMDEIIRGCDNMKKGFEKLK